MTDLSPAALSVWCRFCEVVEEHGPPRLNLAAALRAAADQVIPMALCVHNDDFVYVRHQLHAIADELETL